MANFKRLSAYASREVDASADEIWSILRDWGGVMKWVATGPEAPIELTGCDLREGDTIDVLPCTRICYFVPESGFPPFPETLIHADPEARRIYYNVEGVVSGGMRNYIATTTVDEVGSDRARITCQSTFDLPPDADPAPVIGFLEGVYNKSVIDGMERVAKAERARLVDT